MATQPEERPDAFSKMPAAFRERYAVLRPIGRGGMGEVFLAEDQLLRRQVVLKRLSPYLFMRPGVEPAALRHQLLTEAKRSSAIHSPYVVQVYDVCAGDDDLVLVLEYVNGGNLRDGLLRPMPINKFLRSAIEIAEAIGAAHAASILHCDIKPENILRDQAGTIKVADFGLARVAVQDYADAATRSLADAATGLCGTPGYIAPEVLEGNPPTQQSDIFSLGIVFYEMLTGHNPVKGKGLTQTIDMTLHGPIPPIAETIPEAPTALQHTMNKMLARDPDERYATVRDLLIDLRSMERNAGSSLSQTHLSQRVASTKQLLRARPGSRRTAILFAAALLAIAILVAILWPVFHRQQNESAEAARAAAPIPPKLLAVIPFKVAGGSAQLPAFAEGLRNTVTSSLARASVQEPLEILAASEVRAHNLSSPTEAHRELGVDLVLEGSLTQYGSEVEVNYDLVDASTMRTVDSRSFRSKIDNPFQLEDQVIGDVVAMLQAHFGLPVDAADHGRQGERGTQNGAAYADYLRGLGYLRDFDDPENAHRALESFRRAISADPAFAQAYAGKGETYLQLYQKSGDVSQIDEARAACQKALSMKPDDATTHVCLGNIAGNTGHTKEAIDEMQKALRLDPKSDQAMTGLAAAYDRSGKPNEAEQVYHRAIDARPQYWATYYALAAYLIRHARYAEAAKVVQQAIALSPSNGFLYNQLGATEYFEGNYAAARVALEHALVLRPHVFTYNDLGEIYLHEENYAKAAEEFKNVLQMSPGTDVEMGVKANLADAEYWEPATRPDAAKHYEEAAILARKILDVDAQNTEALLALAYVEAALGKKEDAEMHLKAALKHAHESAEVLFYAARTTERLGQHAEAIRWLKKAVASGYSRTDIATSPDFIALRADPEFQRLIGGHR